MVKMKKLIILTGEQELADAVLKYATDNKWLQETSLYRPIIEAVSLATKLSVEELIDPDQAGTPFKEPFEVTREMLGRFVNVIGMRPVSIKYAGEKFNTPAEVLEYLVSKVGYERWGHDFPVRNFFSEFAYIRYGMFGMSDAGSHIEEIIKSTGRDNVIVVEMSYSDKTCPVLETESRDAVDLVMQCDIEDGDVHQATVGMLQAIKEKLLNKPKEKENHARA